MRRCIGRWDWAIVARSIVPFGGVPVLMIIPSVDHVIIGALSAGRLSRIARLHARPIFLRSAIGPRRLE
jgi:hypothetical protein